MCFKKGNMSNQIITNNDSNFDLMGMINPTWQNLGTSDVIIDGRLLKTGDSMPANCPMLILQNKIKITFENDAAKTKILYVGFFKLTEE